MARACLSEQSAHRQSMTNEQWADRPECNLKDGPTAKGHRQDMFLPAIGPPPKVRGLAMARACLSEQSAHRQSMTNEQWADRPECNLKDGPTAKAHCQRSEGWPTPEHVIASNRPTAKGQWVDDHQDMSSPPMGPLSHTALQFLGALVVMTCSGDRQFSDLCRWAHHSPALMVEGQLVAKTRLGDGQPSDPWQWALCWRSDIPMQ
ncbi:hypothetical protein BKA93DRAFT_754634 [Sparassis latifolia]